jgi:hypothetical protein
MFLWKNRRQMKSFLQFKYNSDLLKLTGIAFCSPICSMTFNFLVFGTGFIELDVILLLRISFSLALLLIGIFLLTRARQILEDIDNVANKF